MIYLHPQYSIPPYDGVCLTFFVLFKNVFAYIIQLSITSFSYSDVGMYIWNIKILLGSAFNLRAMIKSLQITFLATLPTVLLCTIITMSLLAFLLFQYENSFAANKICQMWQSSTGQFYWISFFLRSWDDIRPRNHGRIRHAQPQHVHGTEAKITAIGRHTQDRIQFHTRKQQTTPPRNNQEGKERS